MDIILWRHAEAEDGTPDAKRRLTPRGEKQARKMARWLRKRLPQDVRILASPAVRCQQTAAALEMPFDTTKKIGTSASAAHILEAAGWPNADGTVLVVGHQPTLGEVAALLLAGAETSWPIRKGAVWWISTADPASVASTVLRAAIEPGLA